jgi:hypothetical protein
MTADSFAHLIFNRPDEISLAGCASGQQIARDAQMASHRLAALFLVCTAFVYSHWFAPASSFTGGSLLAIGDVLTVTCVFYWAGNERPSPATPKTMFRALVVAQTPALLVCLLMACGGGDAVDGRLYAAGLSSMLVLTRSLALWHFGRHVTERLTSTAIVALVTITGPAWCLVGRHL